MEKISKKNAIELQRLSIISRRENTIKRGQNIRRIYMRGGVESVMSEYNWDRQKAQRQIRKVK